MSFQLQGRYTTTGARAAEDGALLFPGVEQDAYKVRPTGLRDLYLKSVRWGDTDVTDGEFDVTAGVAANLSLTIVLGADAGRIDGSVSDDKSAPVEGARVMLVPQRGHRSAPFYKTASTDASGHFTLRGIAPGDYKIFAWDTVNLNAVMYDPDFLKPYETDGQSVAIAPNDQRNLTLKVIANNTNQ